MIFMSCESLRYRVLQISLGRNLPSTVRKAETGKGHYRVLL